MKLAQVVQELKKLKVGRLPLIEEKLLPCLLCVIPSHAQFSTELKVNLLSYFCAPCTLFAAMYMLRSHTFIPITFGPMNLHPVVEANHPAERKSVAVFGWFCHCL